jgi:hypothetical protein
MSTSAPPAAVLAAGQPTKEMEVLRQNLDTLKRTRDDIADPNSSDNKVLDDAERERLEREREWAPLRSSKSSLKNDLREMLYGFGDNWPSTNEVVDVVETLATDYIKDLGARAVQVAQVRPGARLDKMCFLYLARKDRKKFQRVHKLLTAKEEIKQVRKVVIEDDGGQVNEGIKPISKK